MSFRSVFFGAAMASTALSLAQMPASAHLRHEYDLLDVRWDVSIDFPNGKIDADVTNTLRATKNGAVLFFDAGKLDIHEATVDGQPAKFENNGSVVEVDPAKPLAAGQVAHVRFKYSGAPEAGIYFVPAAYAFPAKTDIVYTQGEMEDTRFWLPTYDYPDDKATSEGTIHVPAGWSALSNGRLIEVKHEGASDVWHWKMDLPHSTYLISLVAGPYSEVKDRDKPFPVSFWVPKGLETMGKAAFGGTDKIVDFYGRLTGFPYPYPKYSQAAVADFMFGGMENITATTQTMNALHPPEVEPLEDSTGLVAHELAHQWTGDTVTTPSWAHIWINEGWASFLPSFWDREKNGQEAFDIDRYETFQGGLSGHQFSPERSMIWTGYKIPMDMFDSFAYPGGASRMFMLMHRVGEKPFWLAIHRYLEEYKYKNVDSEGFFRSMSSSLGQNLDTFRKQWFYTPAAPSLTVKREDDEFVVHQGKVPFDLTIDALIVHPDGSSKKATANVTAESPAAHFPAQRGDLILVDPEVWIMGNVSYDLGYSGADWKRLYAIAPNGGEKLRIVASGLGAMSVDQKISLARAESSPRLLPEILPALGDQTTLLDYSRNPDPRISTAAIQGLSRLPKSSAITDRLKEMTAAHPNELVRSSAYETLLNMTNDPAVADKEWHTDGFRDEFRVNALNWWGDHAPDAAREIALEQIAHPTSQPVRLTSIRLLGKVKDKPGEHRAYDALVTVFHERSNGALRASVGALAQYGDKAAIPLLQSRADHSLHFVRRDIARALEELGSH